MSAANTRLVRRLLRRALHSFRRTDAWWLERRQRRHRSAVEAVLNAPGERRPLDDESVFEQLQSAYAPLPEYGYDRLSCWTRAAERALRLLRIPELSHTPVRVLETSCGDGMTGLLLASFGHEVQLHDLEDWRDERARRLPMVLGDLRPELPLPADSFEFVCSYNAFEHVTDPAAALSELLRVCRPEGLILLDFSPLYASAWGLHAYRTLRMPFPQFLFSEEFIQQKLQQLGMWDLGRTQTALQPLNRWRLRDFEQLWRQSGCEIVEHVLYPSNPALTDVILRHPAAFRGRDLHWEDVAIEGMRVVLRRRRQS